MAGKSTFIKAVGSAVFLAHIGMGVPAESMKLTLFDGLLTNINVVDNIVKGESFFYNEVQRIKNTILKVNDSRKWLILIDELFKGTNVQDLFVVQKDKAVRRTVHIGLINFDHVELKDNVQKGDVIITSDMSDYKNAKEIALKN